MSFWQACMNFFSRLCAELGITRQTLYRHVSPSGTLRPDGEKLARARNHT